MSVWLVWPSATEAIWTRVAQMNSWTGTIGLFSHSFPSCVALCVYLCLSLCFLDFSGSHHFKNLRLVWLGHKQPAGFSVCGVSSGPSRCVTLTLIVCVSQCTAWSLVSWRRCLRFYRILLLSLLSTGFLSCDSPAVYNLSRFHYQIPPLTLSAWLHLSSWVFLTIHHRLNATKSFCVINVFS